jgi:phosphoribosylanthranilate isomerase
MTRIKICGITNEDDARAAVDYGADALGFILVQDSPRFVRTAAELCSLVRFPPPFVSRVAVLQSPAALTQLPYDATPGLFDTYQFYEVDDWRPDGVRFIHAFRIRDEASLDEIEANAANAEALLLDTYHKDKLGGSGETFNWELAVEAKRRFKQPLVLAGGLTPENVGEAIATVRPYAVDVSSGVEAEPGRKDHTKLRAFIRAVQEADRRLDSGS